MSPKMTKFEIKEYLIKLYNLPVSHVHTAIFDGKKRQSQIDGSSIRRPTTRRRMCICTMRRARSTHATTSLSAR